MKNCPYCGKELPEELQFCPYCMKKLIVEQPISVPTEKLRSGVLLLVVGIAVLVAVCVFIIGFLLHKKQETADQGSTTSPTSQTEHTSITTDASASGTVTTSENIQNGATNGNVTTAKRTTTKSTVIITTRSGSAVSSGTQQPCSSGHSWQAITKTVRHDAVGHYEQQITGYTNITIYKCEVCQNTFQSLDAYYTHFEEHRNASDSLVEIFRDRYTTSTTSKPIYGQKWVVDKPAYTEEVVIGRRCTVCGAEE